ncbi:MAG TPA: hypothetical protein VFC26_01930, partial [Verrucomicrobiae bacterium]|nr:hypothetical protein [Verrucomicrobiae bacterium]
FRHREHSPCPSFPENSAQPTHLSSANNFAKKAGTRSGTVPDETAHWEAALILGESVNEVGISIRR